MPVGAHELAAWIGLGLLSLVFLAMATLAAHAFWRATREERGPQLANFLKNGALLGGLVLAAGWTAPA